LHNAEIEGGNGLSRLPDAGARAVVGPWRSGRGAG